LTAGWCTEATCFAILELRVSGTHQAYFEVKLLVGVQKLKVAFHADRVFLTRKIGSVKMVGLVPWSCVTIEIREELRRVYVVTLFLSTIRRTDIVYHEEVLIMAVFPVFGDL